MTRMTHSDGTITITVNGEHKRVHAGLSIADLAQSLGLVPEKVAVERNLEVVPRSTLAQVIVEDGDELEIGMNVWTSGEMPEDEEGAEKVERAW